MPSWLFWTIWATACGIVMPMWVYGEIGSIHALIGHGPPFAPLAWAASAAGAIGLGVTFADRVSS